MNVLVVTDEWSPDTGGGVARIAAETSRRLVERGHAVTVVAPVAAGRPRDHDDRGVRVLRAVRRGALPRTITDVPGFTHAIHKYLATPDVVVAHQVTTAAAAVRAGIRAPLVLVYHASAWREAGLRSARTRALLPLLRQLERYTTRRAARVVALSRYSAHLLGSDRPEVGARVVIIPGGVDSDVFAPSDGRAAARGRLGLRPGGYLVVAVRRLEPSLGVERVLDAVAQLDGFELALVGDGSLRNVLRERAEKLGISGRVLFAGQVAAAELADWYRAGDVYIQPPAPHEGFGLGIIEALASGTPVAGAAVGAVPELLAPLDRRLVAPTTSPRDLAAAVKAASALQADVRSYAVSNYAWPHVIERWEGLLTELVQQARVRRLEVLGAPLDPLTLADCLALADDAVANRRRIVHTAVNAAKVVRMRDDDELRTAVWSSDVSTADGEPLVWAARLLGRPIPERVAGIDLMEALLEHAARRGYKVYLLGAREHVVAAAAAEIERRHPDIEIVGYRDGYFSPDDDAHVAAEVAAAGPDLLFVALETPRKELFLAKQRDVLAVPFAMGVGGAFDVLAGRRERAPRWAQRLGLEWAFRMKQEPRRLARRYLRGNAEFVALLLAAVARGERRR